MHIKLIFAQHVHEKPPIGAIDTMERICSTFTRFAQHSIIHMSTLHGKYRRV